jgi:hypothetical protein
MKPRRCPRRRRCTRSWTAWRTCDSCALRRRLSPGARRCRYRDRVRPRQPRMTARNGLITCTSSTSTQASASFTEQPSSSAPSAGTHFPCEWWWAVMQMLGGVSGSRLELGWRRWRGDGYRPDDNSGGVSITVLSPPGWRSARTRLASQTSAAASISASSGLRSVPAAMSLPCGLTDAASTMCR